MTTTDTFSTEQGARSDGPHPSAGPQRRFGPLGRLGRWTATHRRAVGLAWLPVLRVLGVLAPKRLSGFYASTPTWTEQGYPAVMDTWRGVIGPPNMTSQQIAFWEDALEKAVATDTWKQELARNTWEPHFLKSAATRKLFDSDYAEYRAILTDLGLKK